MRIKVFTGQDLLDITVQHFGSAEFVGAIINANPELGFTTVLVPGTVLEIPNEEEGSIVQKEFFRRTGINPVNADKQALVPLPGTNDFNNDFNNDF